MLGGGKPLFGDGAMAAGLQLVDSQVTSTGVTVNVYAEPAASSPA